MTCETDDIGQPYVEVPAKRSFDEVPVEIDWHDYIARIRRSGFAYQVNDAVRPPRASFTGLQYRCTTAGSSSGRPYAALAWPRIVGATLVDGSVVWTAEALSSTSMRTTISAQAWAATTGVTLGAQSNGDFRYITFVAGGVSGQSYDIKHQVTLANGEDKEGVAVLPVRDAPA